MPLRTDLLSPISAEHPSGKDLRYDPVFDKIKEARREDIDAPQGAWKTTVKAAEHANVIKLANDVLHKRSKDLQIAVWLVEAHLKREGLTVLPSGFDFIRGLLEQFWDTLYPPIEDGDLELRAGPLEWLGSKLDIPIRLAPVTASGLSYLGHKESRVVGYEADVADSYERQTQREARIAEGKLTAEQYDEAVDATPPEFISANLDAVRGALTSLQALADCCDERFGSDAPGFTNVRKALEDVEGLLEQFARKRGLSTADASAEDSEAASDFEASEPAEIDDFSTSFGSAPKPVSSGFEVDELVVENTSSVALAERREPRNGFVSAGPFDEEDVVRQLIGICRFLRSSDRTDPAAFLVMRAYRWGKLRMFYELAAPPSELRVALKKLYTSGDWATLLARAEEAMELPCGAAWLDLHRYSALALENLGISGAALALRTELRGLLQDVPTLFDAKLLDDTPAAGAETLEWLRLVVMPGAPDSSPPPEKSDAEAEAATDETEVTTEDAEQPATEETDSVDLSFLDTPADETTTESADATTDEAAAPVEMAELPEAPPELGVDDEQSVTVSDEIFARAIAAAKKGNTQDGLQLLHAELARERTNRERFRRRTQLAHLLMSTGHPNVAEPLLQQLCSEIDQRALADWEDGPAVAYPLELLLRCVTDETGEKKAELFSRICLLDPARAVALS